MGDFEIVLQGTKESSVKYHPSLTRFLTSARYPGGEQCYRVSFTGAVSSQKVTEDREGFLGPVGNRAKERMGIRKLNCETHKSSRCESRPK